MILINLLPDEYRARRRAPVKKIAAVAAIVAFHTSLVAWWAWLAFGVASEVQAKRDVLREDMAGLEPQVAYHKDLEREQTQYQSREVTLQEITTNRVSWTRKLDELIDVINQGGGGEKYLIWLDDCVVQQTTDKRKESFGKLRASGHCGGSNFAQVANFLEDLGEAAFISDFYPPATPETTQAAPDERLAPSTYWNFPLEVELKSAEERARVRADAAAAAAAEEERQG